VTQLFNIDFKVTVPYHKASTGSVERVNGTLGASLRKLLEGATATWDSALPAATLYYNKTVRSLHKSSPYALMFAHSVDLLGGEEQQLKDITFEDWNNKAVELLDHQADRLNLLMDSHKRVIEAVYPTIKEMIKTKRQKTASKLNKKRKIIPPLEIGTMVYSVDVRKTSKHDQTYVGPYRVKQVLPTGSYLLENDTGEQIHRAIDQLKIYKPKDKNNDEKSYELERIISHRGNGKNLEYLVSWKGYSQDENSWIRPEQFDDHKIIQEYWKQDKPRNKNKRKASHNKKR
jgi:hypothetical protein